jgi:CubicO group peptidase (beta-lactamase class C family)
MRTGSWHFLLGAALAALGAALGEAAGAAPAHAPALHRLDGTAENRRQIDHEVAELMAKGRVPGLALALIENGQPVYVRAYGSRSVDKKLPLATDTVMYGASLTKLTFTYMVMQLVDAGKIKLDQPIAEMLKKPLPEYEKYSDLAADPRWKALTPRIVLDQTTGFPNFRFLNPDGKLDFKFDPGARYAYSGEGFNLLQFALEEGLRLDVGKEMKRRVFDRFGMTRTSMTWRSDFAPNLADGYDSDGKDHGHDARSHVRAAGSMDTTIADYAKFLAGLLRGDGLSAASRAEIVRPQIAIRSAHQFPTLETKENPANREIDLSAGLGCVVFKGPYGAAFYKGGHDDTTDNLAVCVEAGRRCILLLSNSVRAETIYPALVESVFGKAGVPWTWEYNPDSSPPPVRR